MKLRAVTFDFWGTLYQNTYARDDRLRLMNEALERHGQPRLQDDLEEAYRHARSVWDQVWRKERRSIPIERWMHEMLEYLDAELPESEVVDLGRSFEEVYLQGDEPRPVPGVTAVLPRLSRGYRLGLISDTGLTPGRVLREVLRRDGLLDYFQVLTFSDEIGTAKPLPEPFLHTLRALDVQAEDAAHIGDLPETDVIGARGVGMRAILFLGVSDREDGRTLADGAFEDYDELESLLRRLDGE